MQNNNILMKIMFKVVQCCLWCFEKCLKFITRNAYIFIALKGDSFCSAAKDAFSLVVGNVTRIGTVQVIRLLFFSE